MNIELTTTSRELTKSIVNQMKVAPDNVIQHGRVLGYLVNVFSSFYKAILLEYMGEYYVFSMAWTKGDIGVYRRIGRRSSVRKFDDADACDVWWKKYQTMLGRATTQIYV